MKRIVVLSDPHISPIHGFFYGNWKVACSHVNSLDAAAVIVTGDLCINGPDSDEEMRFAAEEMRQLKGDVKLLPGNHDIGDEPPGQDAKQLVTRERLKRWADIIGKDRWAFDAGAWRLIGLNAQLFGSGLDEEEWEQFDWLGGALDAAKGRPIAVFLHKPLFLQSADESENSHCCMTPAPRGRLLTMLKNAGVRLVVSGHEHQSCDRVIDGIRHVWVPAVAFEPSRRRDWCKPDLGIAVFEFGDADVMVRFEHPAGLVAYNAAAIKSEGGYAFLRDMPSCPPAHLLSKGELPVLTLVEAATKAPTTSSPVSETAPVTASPEETRGAA